MITLYFLSRNEERNKMKEYVGIKKNDKKIARYKKENEKLFVEMEYGRVRLISFRGHVAYVRHYEGFSLVKQLEMENLFLTEIVSTYPAASLQENQEFEKDAYPDDIYGWAKIDVWVVRSLEKKKYRKNPRICYASGRNIVFIRYEQEENRWMVRDASELGEDQIYETESEARVALFEEIKRQRLRSLL